MGVGSLDNKLKAYNIPDLDRVLKDIESDVKMNTYTLDEQTGEEKESMVEILALLSSISCSFRCSLIMAFPPYLTTKTLPL